MNLYPDNQAFPTPNPNYDGNWNREHHLLGLSKREYFAAHAPQEIVQTTTSGRAEAERELGLPEGSYSTTLHYPILVARRAAAYADALLAELDRGSDRMSISIQDLRQLVDALREAHATIAARVDDATGSIYPSALDSKRLQLLDLWTQKLRGS